MDRVASPSAHRIGHDLHPSSDSVTLRSQALTHRIATIVQRVILHVFLILISLLYLMPFVWMISTSLKLDPQVYHIPPVWIPNPVWWRNYPEALTYLPFGIYFLNTIKYCVTTMIGVTVSSSIVAYGFSRLRWFGRDAIFILLLATMMLPFQVQMIPLYLTFRAFGWLNTYLPLIIPRFLGSAYFIFLLRQFFRTIPMELSDAARVDGAREFRILVSIIYPLSKPVLAVVALFQFMDAWNDYLGPLIYLNDAAQYPVALGLQQMQTAFNSVGNIPQAWPKLMAASTVVTLPIVIIYFFTQRVFVEGITLTGLKA
jgi:multiple sugar transport system permease protein